MEKLWQDVRFGVRMLAKHRAYSLVAIIALALGIGANTAIFSVVHAVLLRPLPYVDAKRHVVIESGKLQDDPAKYGGVSPADFWDWKDQTQSFEQIAALRGSGFELTGVDNPETFSATGVSTNFFQLFHAQPLLGRTFVPEDGVLKAAGTIILSHRLWQQKFGGDPAIIGKTLGNTGVEVIGVMPPDFKYPATAELWQPLLRDSAEMTNRANRYFNVIGTIKAGQSLESAQAEMKLIASRYEAQFPATNKNITVQLTPYRDRLVRDVKTSLFVLLGAVTLVLLIACANVANLLLARATSRRKELAIRLAIGATRWQLMRQLLTESLLLAISGAAVGVLLAMWGVEGLIRLLPESYAYLRLGDEVRLDSTVLLFTLGITLLTGLLFGLIPALQASKIGLNNWMKDGTRGSEGSQHQRARNFFVDAEMALALVLLIGAGLLIRSFVLLQQTQLGFDPNNLVSATLATPFSRYPNDEAKVNFYRQILDQLAQTPGIEAATLTSGTPFSYLHFPFNIEGNPMPNPADALYDSVSANYFRVMKAPMVIGREFSELDSLNSPKVAIINESLARQYFSDGTSIGKVISINYLGAPTKLEIIGVAKDLNQGEPGKVLPQIYVSNRQIPWLSTALLIRAATTPTAVKQDVQRAIWAVDAKQSVSRQKSVAEQLSGALSEPRLYTLLLGIFAALSLLLSVVGIYGVMAYSVAQRTNEIGIRMALGAQKRDVVKLVMKQGMKLAVAGIAIGLAASFALTRVMKTLLYNVSATDPLTFALIALLLATVAALACYLPARKATKVDPMTALRFD